MVTSGGMTKRLAALERRGLIRREPDPHDKRSKAVAVTAQGKRLVEEILPEHWANEGRLLRDLSSDERADLAALLERLAVSLGDVADFRRPGAAPPRARRRTT
jgi:DNA-binding MarR family transcriptional regulator